MCVSELTCVEVGLVWGWAGALLVDGVRVRHVAPHVEVQHYEQSNIIKPRTLICFCFVFNSVGQFNIFVIVGRTMLFFFSYTSTYIYLIKGFFSHIQKSDQSKYCKGMFEIIIFKVWCCSYKEGDNGECCNYRDCHHRLEVRIANYVKWSENIQEEYPNIKGPEVQLT